MARSLLRLAFAIALAVASSPLLADPPPEVFGTYKRGYQDTLEVSPGIMLGDVSPDTVFVAFGAHFDPREAHFCSYRGHGTYTPRGIVLSDPDTPLHANRSNSGCRLMLLFSKDGIRVSDAGNKCRASLCSGTDKVDGLFYRRK
jgi:hypothetical protein